MVGQEVEEVKEVKESASLTSSQGGFLAALGMTD
jgi:hypothetical protein